MTGLWWVEFSLVPLLGRGMFVGACELSVALSTLSADEWVCVPVLLVVWPKDFQCWNLQTVVWGQILVQKWGFPGELISINILWSSAVSLPSQ